MARTKLTARISTGGDPPRRHPVPTITVQPALHPGSSGPTSIAPVNSGVLQVCLGMPVEIFAEMCRFLHPLDLRNLIITSTTFRGILMSRKLRQTWKAVRQCMYGPMPDPPEDMSEPQYFRLLFDPQCFTCEDPAVMIDIFNRAKHCLKCHIDGYITHEEASRLLPGSPMSLLYDQHLFRQLHSGRVFNRSRIMVEYDQFAQQQNSEDADAQAAYEAELAKRCADAHKSAHVISQWMCSEDQRQKAELTDRYAKRSHSIEIKMVALGHAPCDIVYKVLDPLNLLYQPYNITDEEWAIARPVLEVEANLRKSIRLSET